MRGEGSTRRPNELQASGLSESLLPRFEEAPVPVVPYPGEAPCTKVVHVSVYESCMNSNLSCTNSHMAKSIDIPQDIIDSVIAAVSDDTHLLKQCSLVSSSFLHPSRKHLFSKIFITNYKTCQGIHHLLIQNPVIQTFVKHITWKIVRRWINSPSLLAILQLPFCCLESFSIFSRNHHATSCVMDPSEDCSSEPWDWNSFSSEMKDALSNIMLSSPIKTPFLEGITNIPTTFFLHTTHLTTLELYSITSGDFCDDISSSLTLAGSKGVAPMASDIVIDRCVWNYGYEQSHW